MSNTNINAVKTLTPQERRSIDAAIIECDRFIAKESARRADLRPSNIAILLADYIQHREKLTTMLNNNVHVNWSDFLAGSQWDKVAR